MGNGPLVYREFTSGVNLGAVLGRAACAFMNKVDYELTIKIQFWKSG